MPKIILLDNFDSFTYNLVDIFRIKNYKVYIYRNNIKKEKIIKKILNLKKPILILSPGPGIPKNSGCMMSLIKLLKGKIPIIGICLGHQAIIESYGGKINKCTKIIHGKSSFINHDQKDMFYKLPNPISVGRYHSLVFKKKEIPNELKINAYKKNLVMAVKNNYNRICGFQFHPESILTPHGEKILENTLQWTYL
ncbi:aminodeoxychorismate/anthranilate synthase component II [Buchnera aphidicola]|uniref:aminodeoxychorismate/anthranilate synthase component II n=1 Tax=Buchnera aphidicola TaxID=9 RepID=UPI0030EC58DD